MLPATRVGDKANCPNDSHGKGCCDHNVTGPATLGSPDVFIDGRPALRIGDSGVHSSCCGSNTWVTAQGSTWGIAADDSPFLHTGQAGTWTT